MVAYHCEEANGRELKPLNVELSTPDHYRNARIGAWPPEGSCWLLPIPPVPGNTTPAAQSL